MDGKIDACARYEDEDRAMLRRDIKIVIDSPVSEVFSYAADVRRLREWLLLGVYGLHGCPGEVAKGSSFRVTHPFQRALGGVGTKTTQWEVTEFVRDERLAWEPGSSPHFRWRYSLELEASNRSTYVRLGEEVVPTSPIGWLFMPVWLPLIVLVFLLSPLIRLVPPLRRWDDQRLRRLQARVKELDSHPTSSQWTKKRY